MMSILNESTWGRRSGLVKYRQERWGMRTDT